MRLIDADVLKKDLTRFYDNEVTAKQLIDEQPTIELEQRWVPFSERLPEEDTEVIVSCTDDSGDSEFIYVTTGWHYKGIWVVGNERSCFVRAWMSLPEPYVERRQDGQNIIV